MGIWYFTSTSLGLYADSPKERCYNPTTNHSATGG